MIKIIIAKKISQKLIGLMGKKEITYGLLFLNTKSIHTFFMKSNIDIIGLDHNMIINKIIVNFNKRKILYLPKSSHILELPPFYSNNYTTGQKLDLK